MLDYIFIRTIKSLVCSESSGFQWGLQDAFGLVHKGSVFPVAFSLVIDGLWQPFFFVLFNLPLISLDNVSDELERRIRHSLLNNNLLLNFVGDHSRIYHLLGSVLKFILHGLLSKLIVGNNIL
jgi:hypothetical protein